MNQEATTAARNDFGHKVPGKCSVSNNTRPILWNKRSLGIGTQKDEHLPCLNSFNLIVAR